MRKSSSLIVMGVLLALILVGAYAVNAAFARAALQTATGTPGAGTATATGQASSAAATQVTGTPKPVSLVRVWSSMCVQGVPYTLISVPPDAKFAVVLSEKDLIASAGSQGAPQASTGAGTPQASTGTGTPQASLSTETPQANNGAGVPVTGGGFGIAPAVNSCANLGTVNGQELGLCTGPQGSRFTLYVHNASGTQTYTGQLWDCRAHKSAQQAVPTVGAGASTLMPVTGTAPAATLPATPQPSATATP